MRSSFLFSSGVRFNYPCMGYSVASLKQADSCETVTRDDVSMRSLLFAYNDMAYMINACVFLSYNVAPFSPLPLSLRSPPSLSLSHTHTHTHIFILYVITPWAFNFSPFCLRYAEKRRNVFLQESEKHRSAFFARSRTRSPFTRCLGHEGAFSFSFSATTLFCSFDSRVVVVVVRHHLDRRSEAIPEQM